MAAVDGDLEMLEAFLDGGLSEAQAEAVRQKLASDPVFGKALEELVAERSTRDEFYASLQRHDSGEDQVVDRLLAGVEKALDESERRLLAISDRRRMIRYISAAAACVLFSFSAGWIGHRHASDQPGLGANLVANQAGMNASNPGIGTLLTSLTRSGPVGEQFLNRPDPNHAGVNVALTDPTGRVLAVQQFDSPDEAREFMQDVAQWQQQQLHRVDPPVNSPVNSLVDSPIGTQSDTQLVREHF